MRKTTQITIEDGDLKHEFRITAMSARRLEAWSLKVAGVLAKSGLLNVELGEIKTSTDVMAAVADALLKNGIPAFGEIDFDKGMVLIDELLAECAVKVDGKLTRKMTPDEVDGIIETLPALVKLQTEAIKVNFDFFQPEKGLSTPASKKTHGITLNPRT